MGATDKTSSRQKQPTQLSPHLPFLLGLKRCSCFLDTAFSSPSSPCPPFPRRPWTAPYRCKEALLPPMYHHAGAASHPPPNERGHASLPTSPTALQQQHRQQQQRQQEHAQQGGQATTLIPALHGTQAQHAQHALLQRQASSGQVQQGTAQQEGAGSPDPKLQICFDFTKGLCSRGAGVCGWV